MTDEIEQPQGNEELLLGNTEVAPPSVNYTYREHIIDRTGELMDKAFAVASEEMRSTVGGINDPRDGTKAHFEINKHGVRPIPASAWDDYRQYPLRREGTVRLTQLSSFIALVNRFKEPFSAIFACDDLDRPALTAIFDYHPHNQTLEELGIEDAPPIQGMHHRAEYAFPLSVEWKAWFGQNGKAMAMGDLAAFLETHIVDVSDDPVTAYSEQGQAFAKANRVSKIATPTVLVDLSRKFRVYETATAVEAVNLTSGETQFTFASEHKDADGKPVDFPSLFSIVIPIFARSTVFYRLLARLRYRLANGKAVFWFELWRPDLTFETAFNEALEQVGEETGLPIYAGSPEAVAQDQPSEPAF